MKKILCFVFFLGLYFVSASGTYAAQTINMATLGNINVRIDGAAASDKLGSYNFHTSDLNNNGIPDLILTVQSGSYAGRTSVGITYIIYDNILSAITGTGNTLDLSTASNWNIRYVGAASSDSVSYYGVSSGDLNGNGKNDLVIAHAYGGHGGTSGRGVVYYIKDDLIDDYSGTGNTVDLATTTNFNTKYIGASADDNFGGSVSAKQDFDNDGKNDLLVTAAGTDYNSRGDSGSAYLIYNTLIDDYSGTGNVVTMGTSTNYNVRFDGAAAGNSVYSYLVSDSGDIDADGKDDLLLSSPNADFGGTDTGSIYLVYNTIIDDYTSTGNTVDLNSGSKYNVRIDGSADNSATFGYSISNFVDLNGDSVNDLLIADSGAGNNSKSYSGSVYILYRSLLATLTGTGNTLDLATSTSYNVRFDGSDADSYFGYDDWATDYNSDGLIDIIADNCCVDNSVFIIYNSIFSSLSGTGNTVNMATSTNYSIKYTGPTNNQFDIVYTNTDLNNDGKIDIINNDALADNNSRTNSGSNYIIYNFPHTITASNVSQGTDSLQIKGTVSATNSVTNISGVQYRLDSNSPTSGWSNCTANDGSFNSTTEGFTCNSGVVTQGTHTMYVRAFDTNTSYTAQSRFYAKTFANGGGSSATSSGTRAQIVPNAGGVFGSTGDSNTGSQRVFAITQADTLTFDAFLSAKIMSPASFFPTTAAGRKGSNAILAGGSILGVKSSAGTRWQVGNVQFICYKAYPAVGTDKAAANIIPSLQKKSSIVALSYNTEHLIPVGQPKKKYNPKLFALASSVDGKTWKIMSSSVVDTVNRTVAALDKPCGYYMIVGR